MRKAIAPMWAGSTRLRPGRSLDETAHFLGRSQAPAGERIPSGRPLGHGGAKGAVPKGHFGSFLTRCPSRDWPAGPPRGSVPAGHGESKKISIWRSMISLL